METVTILRELWRRRVFVGVAAAVAVVVGLMLTFSFSVPPKSRKYEVGVASARILVDTPNSQVVEVAPTGSETLGARASLLANLMTEGEVKQAIAKLAGLRPDQLVAVSESAAEPTELPAGALTKADAHVLTTRLVTNAAGDPLPIIEIEAQAPDAAQAGKLAGASVAGLDDYLNSKAAVEKVSDARRLRVTGLGAPQARADVRGPKRVIALAAAIFVFLVGCALILATTTLARNWRAASERDRLEGAEEPAPSDEPQRPEATPRPETTPRTEAKPRADDKKRRVAMATVDDRKRAGDHHAAGPAGGARVESA